MNNRTTATKATVGAALGVLANFAFDAYVTDVPGEVTMAITTIVTALFCWLVPAEWGAAGVAAVVGLLTIGGCSLAIQPGSSECYGLSLAAINTCGTRNEVHNADAHYVQLGPITWASGGLTAAATNNEADLEVLGGAQMETDGTVISAKRVIRQGQYDRDLTGTVE